MHIDYDYVHTAAIFSLNSCDGFTMLEDGTRIDSKANRMLIFEGSQLHGSTTTTDSWARCNININFF